MSSIQRVLLIVVAVVLAVLLHTKLCEWQRSGPYSAEAPILFGTHTKNSVVDSIGRTIVRPGTSTGLVCEYGVSKAEGMTLGVALPISLLVGAAWLGLGWQRAMRLERGRCLRCGYELKYDYSGGCPECGWRRQS